MKDGPFENIFEGNASADCAAPPSIPDFKKILLKFPTLSCLSTLDKVVVRNSQPFSRRFLNFSFYLKSSPFDRSTALKYSSTFFKIPLKEPHKEFFR